MKLFYSPTSPYVRKVMVTAIEKGLDGKIEKMTTAASPLTRDHCQEPARQGAVPRHRRRRRAL